MARYTFQLRTNGTGTAIGSPIVLGHSESDPVAGSAYAVDEGAFRIIRVLVHRFSGLSEIEPTADNFAPGETNMRQARARVREYAEWVRQQCRFGPPLIVYGARSMAYAHNVRQNFGELQELSGPPTVGGTPPTITVLDNCWLDSVGVDDSAAMQGSSLELTFKRVNSAYWPSGLAWTPASISSPS
jgi:hypothetical protein